jgi:hypothetical protein
MVLINAQCTFDLWCKAKFLSNELSNASISGPAADPDLDGIDNQFEYALGLDPKLRNTATNGFPHAFLNNKLFTFTFTRLRTAADLHVTAQTSSDLQSWSPATPASIENNGLTETVTIEQNITAGTASFFKLNLN